MEENKPKTSVDINDKDLNDEINELEIEVIPTPKIE